jgi:L-lactate dehydrogenase complex protein LldF
VKTERRRRTIAASTFQHPAFDPGLFATMEKAAQGSDAARRQVPWGDLRRTAHDIKAYCVANLDRLLEQFETQVQARGGTVLWAQDAQEAAAQVTAICRRHGATSVVKGKSMLSEEIHLNQRLAAEGIDAVETDLGEFIVQLAGQRPSHIVGPALHLTRADIGALFERKLGIAYTEDPFALMSAARVRLRQRYLEAGVGITGVNFAVAETGAVVVVENEGNGGLSASGPSAHVAVMGIEKVIPRLADLQVFLRLLARAATGQKLTAYTHFFLGAEAGRAFYCIIVDAGRTKLLADRETRQSLSCIRCGACLNVCPVYRRAGGWAYGGSYSGPIGAAIAPVLEPGALAAQLPFASSLCGACHETCPVGIDLPHQLVYLRHKAVDGVAVRASAQTRLLRWWAKGMQDLRAYRRGIRWLRRVARIGRAVGWYPGALGAWSRSRTFPTVPPQSFKEWWERR